jgi:hypothetical protein
MDATIVLPKSSLNIPFICGSRTDIEERDPAELFENRTIDPPSADKNCGKCFGPGQRSWRKKFARLGQKERLAMAIYWTIVAWAEMT